MCPNVEKFNINIFPRLYLLKQKYFSPELDINIKKT